MCFDSFRFICRLWCICRQPHNNRFMICCDKCEDWFHGKCVGITKQMGTEMEQRRAEWICPNCKKKLQPSISVSIFRPTQTYDIDIRRIDTIHFKRQRTTRTEISHHLPLDINSPYMSDKCAEKNNFFPILQNIFPLKSSSIDSSKQSPTTAEVEPQTTEGLCVICHKNPARDTSIFCSDDCIVKHSDKAQTTTTTIDNTKEAKATIEIATIIAATDFECIAGIENQNNTSTDTIAAAATEENHLR